MTRLAALSRVGVIIEPPYGEALLSQIRLVDFPLLRRKRRVRREDSSGRIWNVNTAAAFEAAVAGHLAPAHQDVLAKRKVAAPVPRMVPLFSIGGESLTAVRAVCYGGGHNFNGEPPRPPRRSSWDTRFSALGVRVEPNLFDGVDGLKRLIDAMPAGRRQSSSET